MVVLRLYRVRHPWLKLKYKKKKKKRRRGGRNNKDLSSVPRCFDNSSHPWNFLLIELLLSNNTRTSEERVEHDVAWDKSGPGCGPNLCMCVCLDSKITCTLKASHNCGNIRHLVKWTETKKPKILERNLNCSYIG